METKQNLDYQWVYHASMAKRVVFDYQPSRSRERPAAFLAPFIGTLQTDGYVAYHKLGKRDWITLLACMAHARGYFEKALDTDQKGCVCISGDSILVLHRAEGESCAIIPQERVSKAARIQER